ncbi:hypothetical protein TWF281_004355 [Arthrobotrys megalospora]
MISQIIRTAVRSTSMWSTTRFVPEKSAATAAAQVRQYSQAPTSPKMITLFGTEYSKRKVYTVAGLILLTDIAIFDYYYFFASKKTGN